MIWCETIGLSLSIKIERARAESHHVTTHKSIVCTKKGQDMTHIYLQLSYSL